MIVRLLPLGLVLRESGLDTERQSKPHAAEGVWFLYSEQGVPPQCRQASRSATTMPPIAARPGLSERFAEGDGAHAQLTSPCPPSVPCGRRGAALGHEALVPG